MKNSPLLKNRAEWFYIAGIVIALIIAALAGLHYFGKI
jgi:hypothetical protein